MAQWLRVHPAHTEHLSSAQRTCIGQLSAELPVTPIPGHPFSSSGLRGHIHSHVHIPTCRGNFNLFLYSYLVIYKHIIKNKIHDNKIDCISR